jgi:hypothetical protein
MVLATAPVYLSALVERLPEFLRDVWIPERLAVALHYGPGASGASGASGLAHAARRALKEHAFGSLDHMARLDVTPRGLSALNPALMPVVPTTVRIPARLRRDLDLCASAIALATDGMLTGVLSPNVVLAGGAVRDVLVRAQHNDLDLWVVGCETLAECERVATEAADRVIANGEARGYKTRAILTAGVLTLVLFTEYNSYPTTRHTVQIVKRRFVDVMQVLTSFDMDDAKCAFDGTDVHVTHSALVALRSGVSVVNPWVATRSSRHVKQLTSKGMTHVVPLDAGFMAGILTSVHTAMYSARSAGSSALLVIADTSTLAGIVACDLHRHLHRRMAHAPSDLSSDVPTSSGEPDRRGDMPTLHHIFQGTTLDEVLPGRMRQQALAEGWQLTNPAARMYVSDASRFLDPVF